MVGGSSVQTRIAVTYDDTNGELDFVVDDMTGIPNLDGGVSDSTFGGIGVSVDGGDATSF